MATKYEYYDAGDDWRTIIAASTTAIAQTFTPSAEHTIGKVVLKLYRIGSPGTLTVNIQGVDGNGAPDGTTISTGTTDGDTLITGTGGEGRDIDLTGTLLSNGTQYAIVLTAPSSDGSNRVAWRHDGTGTYAGGKYTLSLDSESTWDDGGGDIDCMFEEWSGDVPGIPTIVSPTPTGVIGITLDETPLEWAAGDPVADTYEIYWRIQGDSWALVGIAQAGIEWTIDFGTLDYGITYEWRIDATNTYGTTTGDTWSFSSISFYPVLPSGITLDGDGNPTGTATGLNNMITIRRLVVAANSKIWYESI